MTSCSKDEEQNYEDESDASAAVVSKIYRACKYLNESFCDAVCCFVDELCGTQDSYKKCDLENGEWTDEFYIDATCNSKCESSITNRTKIEVKSQVSDCPSGWKCLNASSVAYQSEDCLWTPIQSCEMNCIDGACASLCKPKSLSCDEFNNSRVCNDEGNYLSINKECQHGCVDGYCIEINETISNNTLNSTINETIENNSTIDNSTQNNSIEKTCDSCIKLNSLHYDAEGNDCQNPNDEYVIFEGNCTYSCDLTSWTVSDTSSHVYIFPSFTIDGGNSFKLYTGNGTNTAAELYWGSTYTPCKAVWNNDGDNLTLKDQNDKVILFYSYS